MSKIYLAITTHGPMSSNSSIFYVLKFKTFKISDIAESIIIRNSSVNYL